MVRQAGASEVHMMISSPPTSYPCYYGIDTPNRKELISSSHTIAEICRYITADSLSYLSEDGLLKSVNNGSTGFCKACFAGDYPVAFPKPVDVPQMALFEEGAANND